jgi:hypothetical protein
MSSTRRPPPRHAAEARGHADIDDLAGTRHGSRFTRDLTGAAEDDGTSASTYRRAGRCLPSRLSLVASRLRWPNGESAHASAARRRLWVSG